jgi:hypothetical protein
MKVKKPLESIGWLSGAGYQTVIDEEARKVARSTRQMRNSAKTDAAEGKKTKARAAAAKC